MKIFACRAKEETLDFRGFLKLDTNSLSLISTIVGGYKGEVKSPEHAYKCSYGLSRGFSTVVEYMEACPGTSYAGVWHMLRVDRRTKFPSVT